MGWYEVTDWIPTAAAVAIAILALIEAVVRPARMPVKVLWTVGVLLCGGLAVGAVAWQEVQAKAALGAQTALLRRVSSRLAALDRMLPAGKAAKPADVFDAIAASLRAQNAEIADLRRQIAAVRKQYQRRAIDPAAAGKMAAFLRPYGSHSVVLSCARDNVEAYDYANQIADVLRAAGWDARGPEPTAIFGTARSMAVGLYIRGPQVPAAVPVLLRAFAQFDIPYQSRIAPTNAIPDETIVELFVPAKP